MTVVILIMAVLSFTICLVLLIKQFLPKNKSTAEGIKEMQQKGAEQVEQASKKGQRYVQAASKVVEGAEAFVGVIKLPSGIHGKIINTIARARKAVDQADLVTKSPDIFTLLALVSPASAEIYGEPSDSYAYIITEDQDEPFQINQEIVAAAQKIVAGKVFEEEKAKALFEWIAKNIPFGTSGWKKHRKSMRHAREIFEDREGVCAEMAILYIAMARAVGLEANYAKIEINNSGKIERHACVAVKIGGKYIYVDPSYNQFDAKHQGYAIMTDHEAVPHFKSLRGK